MSGRVCLSCALRMLPLTLEPLAPLFKILRALAWLTRRIP